MNHSKNSTNENIFVFPIDVANKILDSFFFSFRSICNKSCVFAFLIIEIFHFDSLVLILDEKKENKQEGCDGDL